MAVITLVRPPLVFVKDSYTLPTIPPLGLAYVAAAAREAGADVTVVDALGEAPERYVEEDGFVYQGLAIAEIVRRISPQSQLIGLTVMFSQDWPYNRRLIRAIRRRFASVPILIGGEHPSALPELSLRDCPELDYCVLGEGEETMVEIVACLRNRTSGQGAKRSGAGRRPGGSIAPTSGQGAKRSGAGRRPGGSIAPTSGQGAKRSGAGRRPGGYSIAHVPGLAYLRDGRLVRTAPRARMTELEAVPWPAWDLFPIERYLSSRNVHGVFQGRSMPLLATRGCPYRCTFCSNPRMYGTRWVTRDPADVLDEIEAYMNRYGATDFPFWDLTMILKREWILRFCRLIEERGLRFTWQLPSGTRAEVVDDAVAAALVRSGCRTIGFAPESGSLDTLERIKKKVKPERIAAAASTSLRHGMRVKCFFIIGFPHETRRDMWRTLWLGYKLFARGIHDAPLFTFSPYPGTELFDEVCKEHYPDGLDDEYFRSIASQTRLRGASHYCRHVGPRELHLWRIIGMGSFYALGFALRPWRFAQFVANVFFRDEKATHLETKLGAMLERLRVQKFRWSHRRRPATG